MMNIWTILIADNYWVKRRKSHTHTFTHFHVWIFLKSKTLMQQQLLGVSSWKKTMAKEEILLIHVKKQTQSHKEKHKRFMPFIVFLPLFFHVLLTVRSESVWNNIHSHTISYMIMEEQKKINQDQGRKQTAERLNFRFFFNFLSFFLRLRVVSR